VDNFDSKTALKARLRGFPVGFSFMRCRSRVRGYFQHSVKRLKYLNNQSDLCGQAIAALNILAMNFPDSADVV
jgi:hypothetical protein